MNLDDLVKHIQETCGLSRNPELLIPRAFVIILLPVLSVQYAAAAGAGKEPRSFKCLYSTEQELKRNFRLNSRLLL